MNHGAALVEQEVVLTVRDRLDGLALTLVFLNGIVDRLRELGLDLRCCNGDSVDEEHQVQGFLSGRLVMHLVHDAKDVRIIEQLLLRQARIIREMAGTGQCA